MMLCEIVMNYKKTMFACNQELFTISNLHLTSGISGSCTPHWLARRLCAWCHHQQGHRSQPPLRQRQAEATITASAAFTSFLGSRALCQLPFIADHTLQKFVNLLRATTSWSAVSLQEQTKRRAKVCISKGAKCIHKSRIGCSKENVFVTLLSILLLGFMTDDPETPSGTQI